MDWPDIVDAIADWRVKIAGPAADVRRRAGGLLTSSHVGYYVDAASGRVGVHAPPGAGPDAAMAKAAVAQVSGDPPLFLSTRDLAAADSAWVKVAYSESLRRAGEVLNFFPGQYAGGVPNSPSPVAAMLTSGLLGAGVGWAGGRLLGRLLPGEYGRNLGRTGAVVGGLAGAAPGAVWGGTNTLVGRRFNDPSLLAGDPAAPVDFPTAVDGANAAGGYGDADDRSPVLEQIRSALETAPARKLKFGADIAGVALGRRYADAAEKAASAFGAAYARPAPHPADVNIDRLGRTLWEADASPALAASTMAGMYAAQQMPDPNARPGWATGHQLGLLAANAAGDYARGYLVGAAINAAVGTPWRAGAFGAGAAALGVIGSVVPRLFGG